MKRHDSGLDSAPARRDERGMALVLAVIVLTAMVLGALFVLTATVSNRRMTSDVIGTSKALHVAEAGVAEAFNRIQNGEGPDPLAVNAPALVVQVLLTAAPGAAGADTTLLATGQPAGSWLNYSTASSGSRALTIEFKTNAARTTVYRYDKTRNPPIQTTTGDPIYRITSTGTVGGVSRRLVVEAVRPLGTYDVRGAVVSGVDIKYTGSGTDCGYNHSMIPVYPVGENGRIGVTGCSTYETGSGDEPGTLTYGTFTKTGPSEDDGVPPVVSGAAGAFYDGPWDIFHMSKAQFLAWVGPPVSTPPAVLNGVYYVDNDATTQNQSCNISYAGSITGSGLLYVDGDLTMNNNFHFKGLVYCEGKLTATNKAWVLGAVVARGHAGGQNDMTGPNTFLYSTAALQAIPGVPAIGSPKVRAISWTEMP